MKIDETKCKKIVYPNDRWGCFHPHQCHFKPWKDGFCKKHHPEEDKKREEVRNARLKAKIENDPLVLAYKEIDILNQRILELENKIKELGG